MIGRGNNVGFGFTALNRKSLFYKVKVTFKVQLARGTFSLVRSILED